MYRVCQQRNFPLPLPFVSMCQHLYLMNPKPWTMLRLWGAKDYRKTKCHERIYYDVICLLDMPFFPECSTSSFLGVSSMLHRHVKKTIYPISLCGKEVSMRVAHWCIRVGGDIVACPIYRGSAHYFTLKVCVPCSLGVDQGLGGLVIARGFAHL